MTDTTHITYKPHFLFYESVNRILSKIRKEFKKSFVKDIQIFLKKNNTKNINMLVNDIEI